MEENPSRLPVSNQETQIEAPKPAIGGNKKIKILGGLLGILVFVGAVFGAYKLGQKQTQPLPSPTPPSPTPTFVVAPSLQPTPTPAAVATPIPLSSEAPAKERDLTANWKTYTNTKYGISIKYPPDYQVKEEKSPVGLPYIYMVSVSSRDTPTEATHVPNIGIYVYNKGGLTLRQLYEQNKTTSFNNSIDVKEAVVNGIQVLQFSEVPAELGIATAGRHVLFNGGKYIVDVTDVAEETKENPVLQPIFDQILSTFKFLE